MYGAMMAVFAILPMAEPVRETVATIEHNTVYSDCGNVTLRQWIFHDKGEIRDWRLVHREQVYRDFERGGYVLLWTDGDVFREIRALSFEDSHTQYDPEVHARDELPKERRRALLKISN